MPQLKILVIKFFPIDGLSASANSALLVMLQVSQASLVVSPRQKYFGESPEISNRSKSGRDPSTFMEVKL